MHQQGQAYGNNQETAKNVAKKLLRIETERVGHFCVELRIMPCRTGKNLSEGQTDPVERRRGDTGKEPWQRERTRSKKAAERKRAGEDTHQHRLPVVKFGVRRPMRVLHVHLCRGRHNEVCEHSAESVDSDERDNPLCDSHHIFCKCSNDCALLLLQNAYDPARITKNRSGIGAWAESPANKCDAVAPRNKMPKPA